MTLEKLLQDYSQLLNVDSHYNSTILKKEDPCAANSKQLYGYYMNFLIRNMIKEEKDVHSIKDFVITYSDNFHFDYKIVATIFARHLSMNLSDADTYSDFSNYILKYYHYPDFRGMAEKIMNLVAKKQFESALKIVKALS